MGSTKSTFPSNHFPFLKFCFSLGTSYIELIWCTNHPNVHIHNFWKYFTLGCFFPVNIFKIDLNVAEIRNVQDYVCTKKLIWMKVHIFSVKPKSHAGNIRIKYIMTIQKGPKPKENQLGILAISCRQFMHSVGNSAEDFVSRRECYQSYLSIFENFCLIYWCV